MPPKTIRLNNVDALTLLLNLRGHDSIHDYKLNEDRWEKNYNIIKQFQAATRRIEGGAPIYHINSNFKRIRNNSTTIRRPHGNKKVIVRSSILTRVKPPPPPPENRPTFFNNFSKKLKRLKSFTKRVSAKVYNTARRAVVGLPVALYGGDLHVEAINAINDCCDFLKVELVFSLFSMFFHNAFIQRHIDIRETYTVYEIIYFLDVIVSQLEHQMYSDSIIPFKLLDFRFIFKTIINKIQGKLYRMTLQIKDFATTRMILQRWFETICNMLFPNNELNDLMKISIIENFTELQYTGGARRNGVNDDVVSEDEARDIITFCTTQMDNIEPQGIMNLFTQLQDIWNAHNANLDKDRDTPLGQKQEYSDLRMRILNLFKDKLNEYRQNGKAGAIIGGIEGGLLIPVLRDRTLRNQVEIYRQCKSKLDIILLDFHNLLRQFEEMKNGALRKAEKDRIAAAAGTLGSREREIRQQFIECVARSSLMSTNVCDINGNLTTDSVPIQSILQKQIDILKAQANWVPTNSTTKDLDFEIIELAKREFHARELTDIRGIPHFPTTGEVRNRRYCVNNAAMIPSSKRETNVFCPDASTADGMSHCSINSGEREYGDMDFYVGSDTYNIKGTLTHTNMDYAHRNKGFFRLITTQGGLTPVPGGALQNTINTQTQHIPFNDPALEAHYVLSTTLSHLLTIYDDVMAIDVSQPFFTNLLEFMKRKNDYSDIFEQLLVKVIGDFFQEICCVCRNGGYSDGGPKYTHDSIIKWDEDGLARRFFVANDRVSAFRFAFILINGHNNDINTKAYGGYYSSPPNIHIWRKDVITGGKSKNQTQMIQNPIRQRSKKQKRSMRKTQRRRNIIK